MALAGCIALLIGAALSLRFNVFVLVESIAGAVLGAVVFGIGHDDGIGSIAMTVFVIATALQIGFLLGIVLRAMIAAATDRPKTQPNIAVRA
jgi:hypothetical protein